MRRTGKEYSVKLVVSLILIMFIVGFFQGFSHLPDKWLLKLLPEGGGIDILTWYLPGEKVDAVPWLAWYDDALAPEAVLAKGGIPAAFAMEVTAEPETTLPYPGESGFNEEKDSNEDEVEEPETNIIDASGPIVCIYNSHNAECYAGTSGVDRLEGKNGGVYQAATAMKEAFEKEGIPVVQCDTIHDYPNWALSYQNSLASMQKLKEQYPTLEVFIDVHRDVAPSQGTTVYKLANGDTAAKIMLIVGSNNRLEHPNWQKNLEFSKKIGAALETAYPGIMRGVRVQDGRYNQHFSTKAILVEVGSTENTNSEAKNSGVIIAEVISKIIRNDN